MHALVAQLLQVRHLRNLASVDLEPGAGFNVISGDNGHGKTSILESLYVVATTRSFRTSKLGDLTPTGSVEGVTSVRATLNDGVCVHEQSVGLQGARRSVRCNGERPATLASYASRTPVVVFSPSELELSMGPGSGRRKLLDRVSLYASPAAFDASEAFVRASRERQRALETRGTSARDLPEWEQLVARHGSTVMVARAKAASLLAQAATLAFASIAARGRFAAFAYAPSAPQNQEAYERALFSMRSRDLARGSATVGPNRDDLAVTLGGISARQVASQGQHRAIVLALKMAEIEVISEARQARPILLLDDVSSELDRARTTALFAVLGQQPGQVFLTTTRPDLLDADWRGHASSLTRRDFVIEEGAIRQR